MHRDPHLPMPNRAPAPRHPPVEQDDFLAQLDAALARYDSDGDGLLSEAQWRCVEIAFQNGR
ncbi:hypothetical protein AQS8620_01112 [Aquimixticola soesokkakensis]|uniref:EF-hand domain-containing protein n=1 Tax=Aquimixticola soesokkakensis TaxID=1519096 RepID=A0A1Y5S5B9_9RHOB|nr:hypothetical protein [Aquimixticola soesokkakensis]SLN32882.1 hypothetical protein AQS8620_01112 [Aquimixticola soesokkakensis]